MVGLYEHSPFAPSASLCLCGNNYRVPNWFKSQNNPPVSSPHPTIAKAVKNRICF